MKHEDVMRRPGPVVQTVIVAFDDQGAWAEYTSERDGGIRFVRGEDAEAIFRGIAEYEGEVRRG